MIRNIIFTHACLNYEVLLQCLENDDEQATYFNGVVDGLCWALGAITGEKQEEARKKVVKAAGCKERR